MIYAIIEDGNVVNIAVANSPVEDNWVATDGLDVRIGDTYDGEAFFHDGEKIITEEERLRAQLAEAETALDILLGEV